MSEYEKYIKAWKKRMEKSHQEELELEESAKRVANICADFLAKEFGVKKVYLFGSLAEGYFHKGSDIDLAVEGLRPELYFKALSKLYRKSKNFEINIIPLEDCKFKNDIYKEGKVLYNEGKS